MAEKTRVEVDGKATMMMMIDGQMMEVKDGRRDSHDKDASLRRGIPWPDETARLSLARW